MLDATVGLSFKLGVSFAPHFHRQLIAGSWAPLWLISFVVNVVALLDTRAGLFGQVDDRSRIQAGRELDLPKTVCVGGRGNLVEMIFPVWIAVYSLITSKLMTSNLLKFEAGMDLEL